MMRKEQQQKKTPYSCICGKILEHTFILISLLRHSFLSEGLSRTIKQEQRAETVFMCGSSSCQQQDVKHLEFPPIESVTPVSWLFLSAAFCFLICLAAHSVDDFPLLVFIKLAFPRLLFLVSSTAYAAVYHFEAYLDTQINFGIQLYIIQNTPHQNWSRMMKCFGQTSPLH